MQAEVLVISDTAERCEAFAVAAGRHFECAAHAPGDEIADVGGVFAIIADVSLDVPASVTFLRILKAKCMAGTQLLVVMRAEDRRSRIQAQSIGGTVFLRVDVDPSAVAGRLLQLAAARPDRLDGRLRAAVLGAQGACAALTNIFEAAHADRAIDARMVEAGTQLVMDAIEQGGIANWLEAVRAYDDRIYQHSLMVGGLAAAFSTTLGFAAGDRLRFVRATLVHDVGKAKIPVSILKKPGRLEPHEASIVRSHPKLGREMLESSGVTDPAMLEIALHHHELLDGSGYPDGLKGDQIGDFVRLATVCDIYAALVCPRPPRAAFSVPEALEIIEADAAAGKLEPAIVRMFGRTFAAEPTSEAPRVGP
ncbi:HD-GYP domain-containing protein [Methylorubrum extorquens]|jgi:putative nucleotidyltransferase with HDIG domain|uniref:Metal dependent phosphohydrolase (HD domain) n=1 Tax=Methylorubrum extorquens (strain ATCC 14718 / DSM 1338 / JCM 2805 / NCIMB 9133 / AM1) TaxID=272630 RepID=C5B4V0_METEA|nr:HD domain-containing phosphohydrolase [Methylorubrum extorquens]ACS43482.1 putative metal dependent phosphohydrolase (HD domain) [Methylorubrum extorquens AM1]MCP1545428.1 putative nucleotidyltransferase with HDIG domain [Methylorubrum extorquens]MCP1591379.1 putative nucleotidyltransferase with HDIG domain [Methylorubrum extorquens]